MNLHFIELMKFIIKLFIFHSSSESDEISIHLDAPFFDTISAVCGNDCTTGTN